MFQFNFKQESDRTIITVDFCNFKDLGKLLIYPDKYNSIEDEDETLKSISCLLSVCGNSVVARYDSSSSGNTKIERMRRHNATWCKIDSLQYIRFVMFQSLNRDLLKKRDIKVDKCIGFWGHYAIAVSGVDFIYKFNFEDLEYESIAKIKKLNKKLMKHMKEISRLLSKDIKAVELKVTMNEIEL